MTTSNITETFSVRLPDELKAEVDRLATMTKRSRSFIVKEAVAAYMHERTAYMRELDEAMQSAASGVGHSGDQIFDWMRSWGTRNELPEPKPDIRRRTK